MYIPDRAIVAQLKELDKSLFIKWNAKKERWEVWDIKPDAVYSGDFCGGSLFHVRDLPYHVMTVQNQDGSYRPLDGRTVSRMVFNKAVRDGDFRRYLRELDEHNQRIKDDLGKEKAEQMYYQTLDDYRLWRRWTDDECGYTSFKGVDRPKVYLNTDGR